MTKKKETSLATIGSLLGKDFGDVIKRRMMEKYADDAIKMVNDFKALEKAYKKMKSWMEHLNKGEVEVIEEYKKNRYKLENEDGFTF